MWTLETDLRWNVLTDCVARKCLAMGMRGDSVQVERRPGRPSLSVTSRRAPLSRLLEEPGEDVRDVRERERDYDQEKFIMFNSLNQFKQTLQLSSSNTIQQDKLNLLQGPLDTEMFDILPPSITTFSISPPATTTTININNQAVSETASRILFLSVHWTKNIPVFRALPTTIQVSGFKQQKGFLILVAAIIISCYHEVSVLRAAWPGLFLLGLIQCRQQVGISSLLAMAASHLQTCLQRDSISLVRVRALLTTLNNIKLTAGKLECLELDHQEFAYLRLFSLFRFSECQSVLAVVSHLI